MLSNKLFICKNRRIAKAIKNEDSANKAKAMFFLNKYETVMSGTNFARHIVQTIAPRKSVKNAIV